MAATASRRTKILITIVAIVVSLIVLEIAARLIDPRSPMVVRDPDFASTGNPVHPEIDSAGFRNESARGDICIVLLGDSQIFGMNIDYESIAPRRLETEHGIKTYSMAMPGHGPLHQLAVLDKVIAKSPRVVITPIYFGNDIYDIYSFWASQRGRSATLREKAIPFLDALPVWEKSVLDGKSPHLVADGHSNAHGHAMLAQLIAGSVPGECAPR